MRKMIVRRMLIDERRESSIGITTRENQRSVKAWKQSILRTSEHVLDHCSANLEERSNRVQHRSNTYRIEKAVEKPSKDADAVAVAVESDRRHWLHCFVREWLVQLQQWPEFDCCSTMTTTMDPLVGVDVRVIEESMEEFEMNDNNG